jgi:integrase
MKHIRNRYQAGSLTTENRKNGSVWVYRWRDAGIHRKQIVGTKAQFPTKTAALKQVDGLRLDINTTSVSNTAMTVSELVEHYNRIELSEDADKTKLTRDVYGHHLSKLIVPKWGDSKLGAVKAFAVEAWLKTLPYAEATKSKTRNIMSAVYQHAIRYGWCEANPIRAVRQGSKRVKEPDVLTPDEVSSLLAGLPLYCQTAVLIAATTGLRRGEIFGLKWEDVDFQKRKIFVVRSVVDQVAGEPKTEGSKRPLPLPDITVQIMESWQKQATYSEPTDWIFASDFHAGDKPMWPDVVLKRHVRPAATAAGITKTIGWHTFRRSYATLLSSSGAGVKTLQDLMRHATPAMSLGTYAQSITADKRSASDVVAGLYTV